MYQAGVCAKLAVASLYDIWKLLVTHAHCHVLNNAVQVEMGTSRLMAANLLLRTRSLMRNRWTCNFLPTKAATSNNAKVVQMTWSEAVCCTEQQAGCTLEHCSSQMRIAS